MRDIERRYHTGLELREREAEVTAIEGYASVFSSLSEDLGGFREMIMPGAFDRALKEEHDVRALVNHDSNLILGRTKSGTLKLEVDETGLKVWINPPQARADTLEQIRRGDLDQMSFAFRTVTDDWRTEEKEVIREVHDLELVDVSVVAFPAYPQTQVSARALDFAKQLREGGPSRLALAKQKLAEIA